VRQDYFARLKEILLRAADLSDAERSRYLDDACKDDPGLRLRAFDGLLNTTKSALRCGHP
jgi:hypothetical protein